MGYGLARDLHRDDREQTIQVTATPYLYSSKNVTVAATLALEVR